MSQFKSNDYLKSNKNEPKPRKRLPQKLLRIDGKISEFNTTSASFHVPHTSCFENVEVKQRRTELINNLRYTKIEIEKEDLEEIPELLELPETKKKLTFHEEEVSRTGFSFFSQASSKTADDYSVESGITFKSFKSGYSLTDLNSLIDRVKHFKDDDFVYLTYAVPKSSPLFTPYTLIEVPYSKIDRNQYYAVSKQGVSFWSCNENHFTKLNDWIFEYQRYCYLMNIKLFKTFRIWKGFKVWRKTIQWQKYETARNFIQEHLFIGIPQLAKALLQLQSRLWSLKDLSFTDVSVIENWFLFYFIEAQMTTYEHTSTLLHQFRNEVKTILFHACYRALLDKNFSPEDEIFLYPSMKKMKENMTSIDRAKKRRYCILLTNFLSCCDYMIINYIYNLVSKAFRDYANLLDAHDNFAPTEDEIRENINLDVQLEKPRETSPKLPFIKAELALKAEVIEVDPSRTVMLNIVNQICDLIMETAFAIKRFQSDPFFKLYTEPSIMGVQEEKLGGDPPDLNFLFEIDDEYNENVEEIPALINDGYDKLLVYLERFEPIRKDYEIDLKTEPKTILKVTDVETLRKFCERYVVEVNNLEGILPEINLGLFTIKQATFKEDITPVCKKLVSVLDAHLPQLAIQRVDQTISKIEDLIVKLQVTPEDTYSWVSYLRALELTQNTIDTITEELKYAYELFILMKDYDTFIDISEKDRYLDTEELIETVQEILNKKLEEKPQFVEKLSECLREGFTNIFTEVDDVKNKTVEPWLILETSDRNAINETLTQLYDRVANCQILAQEYRKFQREFRIDLTRVEAIDLTLMEVKNRQLLWASHDEWNESIETWTTQNFHTLDVEELINVNQRILKNCTVLEKYVPENTIVPKLRESCEDFKEKLHVIGYLRSPALKTRHWLKMEQVLGRKLISDEGLCLQVFEDANAFTEEISNQIMEIAGQASAEAGLEILLKKIENLWKDFELSIVPHRDSKNVFILAGLEEIQANLDESMININTIAASRHVGPIKARVDEWLAMLDLFGNVFEEWITCQQQWIYLEVIFSAPDIQRQLPNEARMFLTVDKTWKDLMRKAHKMPLALMTMTEPTVLEKLQNCNLLLDRIMKSLEVYLEIKRTAFPRFYFLSNDELLEILAQTRNPHAVQPHLRKCFDAINLLEFGSTKGRDGAADKMTNDILAMISPENEKVQLGVGLKARGSVEDWLGKVEEAMIIALKRCMRIAFQMYPTKDRAEWFQEHPNQVVLTVSQQQWASSCHQILDSEDPDDVKNERMVEFEKKLQSDLTKLASIARTDISKLVRKILCALITIDVHAMDTVDTLVKYKVTKSSDFNWLKMIRYYWEVDTNTMSARMASACLPYYYEYLGAGGVLVITPLTDRCYLCLMGALQMDLGGAPAGPAGTGKTETTKDLAKALAKQCVVFNCSEGLDYKMMGRFFSGLAQCGAWCCFDEFNRIDIEVLSVIAQQLITIRSAKAMRLKRFFFEGREIKLNFSCAAFITMNPGYAGRTELPDNLKALFRPIAMMVPDYALIAEVILYSEGFVNSKILAQKMVQMYKLCSEQLSQQDHYDFGMRAVKSVLVMAGALKRAVPDQNEDITLIAALRDSNLPKFLADDVKLFKGILNDLFPGIDLPEAVYGYLQAAIESCMVEYNLQPVPDLIVKTVQLYETMCVRWGVMLVGTTGGGKSTVLNTLARALSKLNEDEVADPNYRHVRVQSLNPKSVSLDELYGGVNSQTLEWKDGLIGLAVRSAVNVTIEEHQWIVFDGPVDAVWIESMNTVLDDNKMLCLASSERIKLTAWVHLIFEVQDLAQASPATVSRCGMVYVDPGELGWLPLVQSWRATIPEKVFNEALNQFIFDLYNEYFDKILKFGRKHGRYSFHQVETSKLTMMFTLITSLIERVEKINSKSEDEAQSLLKKIFFWCALWSVGSNYLENARDQLEEFIRTVIPSDVDLPDESLWECRLNLEHQTWESWSKLVPCFKFNANIPYFELLVQTTDTARFGYIAELLFEKERPVMFTGDTGVGKSILATSVLDQLSEGITIPVVINFSAQTNSKQTQETIEARLDKRKKTLLGAPIGKKIIFFIDDVNMPALDTYGSQPPIELLRQFLDYGGLFDRDKMFWKEIVDVVLGCACAPPGGGRNAMTARFVRHFGLLQLPLPSSKTLTSIFAAIITGFLSDFVAAIRPVALPIVDASVLLYNRIAEELLPTPAKSHYVFNLRDLSKLVQGILQAESSSYVLPAQILRLFYHEAMRVFHDRLINEADKKYFTQLMDEISMKYFEKIIVKPGEVLIFGDFMIFGQAKQDRVYEEIKDMDKLKSILMDYLDDYNGLVGKEMNLILFQDAIEHVVRLARILRSERANALLVGLSGMGKQSLSRLGAHINGYRCSQIELSRGYDRTNFCDDLRKMYVAAGVKNIPTVFLITDTQIVKEDFLEDINNILNSGEVPNLFEGEDYENVLIGARQFCIDIRKKDCTRDDIYNFFINRVRANLHVVICMSPVGDAFRRRCRMFPSLVNCCTIDWFVKWPPEALYSVAFGALTETTESKEQREHISSICVMMHEVVEQRSLRLYAELKRYYYTTPSSYLELLKLYQLLLKKRTEIIKAKRTRIANGLNKLLESNELVAVMGEELKKFQPIIESSSANMKELLLKLDKDTQAADIVRTNVTKDEAEAKIKKDETMAIAEDASKDLEIAMPALRGANEALKALNKADVNELRSFLVPPKLVQFVMEPVCIMLGAKPDWGSAKSVMADVNFLKRLVEFDKEHIPEKVLTRLKFYINHKDFDPVKVEKVSRVCKSMVLWVTAIDEFAKVYKIVEPKIKRHQAAEAELKAIMLVLKQKQSELAEIEGKIQGLKDVIEVKNREFQEIQDIVNLTSARLNRAGRLTSALSDEEVRWKNTVQTLTDELWAIPGDTLVASAFVAYVGAFPIHYRKELATSWGKRCRELNIPSSEDFDFLEVLGDAYEIRSWNMFGLPKDETSIENGIIVMKAFRWPLMIDPQEQANQWIRNMEKENGLRIIKMTDSHLLKILEICIRQGLPLLIEEMDETIDPTLGPILSRDITSQAGRLLIRLGDTEVDYDANFKLYMTTKLSNPHYLPEICIKVTLVNFLVTATGLEDQLLAEVVAIELPELEKQRSDLIVRINTDKQQLVALEDKVLKLLYNSQGNILDDEELVETLNESKETSGIIAARLVDTEKTEAIITVKREAYRKLATRGATLFFCVSSLADIDSMYQNSLKYFTQIFKSVIQSNRETYSTLENRLENLMNGENYSIYQNISRGLFEKHKLIFSFMLGTAICKESGTLSNDQFQFLLRGPLGTQEIPPNRSKVLNEYQWKCCYILQTSFTNFNGLCDDLLKSQIYLKLGDFQIQFTTDGNGKPQTNWDTKLDLFEKLLLIKVLKSEKLVYAVGAFVRITIGSAFTEIPKNNTLSALFEETSSNTPLVFILSTGSDPMAALLRFADSLKYREKLFSISLGQGQGPAAASLLDKGRVVGNWVFLQNCHLATSWMPSMEKIIRDIALNVTPTHNDFRIFLSSVPTKSFPVSVLQNSLKLTNEPPKGLRANMIRALTDMSATFFEVHNLGRRWQKMIFGLCMFHAVVLERRKFGPLGWNIMYDFSESDRECGLKVLEMFCQCDEPPCDEIQWPSLEYINGEITWGGRVTDYWDQRCLRAVLKIFSSPVTLTKNYVYSSSGIYKCPDEITKLQDYLTYVQQLPMFDAPDIFGMHENANIVFESKETHFVLDTLLECTSTTADAASESEEKDSPDTICLSMIEFITNSLTNKIKSDDIHPSLMKLDAKGRVPSLTTVLLQELERYNKLLGIVHKSLVDLEKAIKGFIVMSESLEAIYHTFLNNQIPALWASKGFLSVKSLAAWIVDFQYRIDYIQCWVSFGEPRSNWISGLFFPQSFLTGTLQTHSRRYNLPIDALKIDFEILQTILIQKHIYRKHITGAKESPQLYAGLDYPDVGVLIHGLYVEGGRWDLSEGGLCDAKYGELVPIMPVIWLKPCLKVDVNNRYEAPLYKTQVRAGVLSTTGHSTNFVLAVLLNSLSPPAFWILRGTALFTMVSD